MKLFWLLITLPLIWLTCGGSTDPVADPGVRYSRTEVGGARVELVLMWDKQRAVVGSGTKQDIKTIVRELNIASDIAEIRALFIPELLTIYQQDSAIDPGANSVAVAESWVTVEQGKLSPARLFIFHGTPVHAETIHMLEKLDGFTRALLN